jgi:benzoyl-CoA 2,3-dioxygenase component A
MLTENLLIQQHLIDPEICIRCNTCEASCPEGAVTHDDRNYVVDAQKCNHCMACVPPCPTGSIDNWRSMPRAKAYSVEAQLGWDELPPALSDEQFKALGVLPESISSVNAEPHSASHGATVPPWSAAHPYTNLHGPKNPITATVVGNVQVNEAGTANETHHIMLDFGSMPFPVLEGQSIGIVPSGADASGKAHHARQYSVASPRNGERAGYNNLSLTVKRVKEDHQGQAIKGVCSNYLCDLQVGQKVQVIGPFGSSFLMPNQPQSNIVMICTGTGSAPMRAMTEWRRRLRQTGKFEGGKLMLFFGARTQQELPYFGPLQKLPKDFIDINFAFSRTPGQPKRYVQDLMQERAADLGALLKDGNTCIYVCGLKRMEEGVLVALHDVATQAGMNWSDLGAMLQKEGRLHLETY